MSEPEVKFMSVGFADLYSYFKVSQKLNTSEMIELLNQAFQKLGDIIYENDGEIRKYLGDAVMFTLNDPSKSEKVAKAIVGCFRREVEELVTHYKVGIATGDVFLNEIGHPNFRQLDIFGDTVNNAAKLEMQAGDSSEHYLLCEETKKYI